MKKITGFKCLKRKQINWNMEHQERKASYPEEST